MVRQLTAAPTIFGPPGIFKWESCMGDNDCDGYDNDDNYVNDDDDYVDIDDDRVGDDNGEYDDD